jgi:hypothetical protein
LDTPYNLGELVNTTTESETNTAEYSPSFTKLIKLSWVKRGEAVGLIDVIVCYKVRFFAESAICFKIALYLYDGCETWSLTLREEHRLRVFENRVLRRIFGPKRDEVTRGWRKLHNGELHNLYSSPSIIRTIKLKRMRLAGHAA